MTNDTFIRTFIRSTFARAPRFRGLALSAGVILLAGASAACDGPVEPTPTRSVEIVFTGPVNSRPDLPASAQSCVQGVLTTRIHVSWRNFEGIPMSAALSFDSWNLTLHDVPVNETVRFRINDKNWCDRNPTGAVLDNVTANGVALVQNTTTPGPMGDEPGFAFTVDESRVVRQ